MQLMHVDYKNMAPNLSLSPPQTMWKLRCFCFLQSFIGIKHHFIHFNKDSQWTPGPKQIGLTHSIRHLHVNYLLFLHSGWKMQPQGPDIWPGWKAPLFVSLHSANRGKYAQCQQVTDITPPHHSHPTPRVARIDPRNKPKHTASGSNSQSKLLEHGQHTLLVILVLTMSYGLIGPTAEIHIKHDVRRY